MTPKTRITKSLEMLSIILMLAASSLSALAETPRYLYALSQNSTILINAVTKKTGVLRSLGYAPVPGSGAVAMVMNPSGTYLYVANSGSNDVAGFSVNAKNGQLTSVGPNAPAGGNPSAITIDPRGDYVYVCDALTNDVFSYAVNGQNGMLMPVSAVPTGGQTPASLVIDPTNTYLFVANKGSNNISVLTLNSGMMTPLQTLQAGTGPVALAMHRSGQFLYAVNEGSDNISAYALSPASGLWNPIAGNFTTGTAPLSLAFTPSGTTLYVANSGSNSLSYYTVNGSTGVLTPAKTKVPAGTTPSWVGVDPSGTFAFVANVGSGDVESYQVGGNGKPTLKSDTQIGLIQMATAVVGASPITFEPVAAYIGDALNSAVQAYTINYKNGKLTAAGSEVPADSDTWGVAVDYLGRFAYAANDFGGSQGDISGYTADHMTWELTPTSPTTFQAYLGPAYDLIDASGSFVYVTNFRSGTVSAYAIDQSNGTLTHVMDAATGPGPWGIASDPWGRFLYTANLDGGGISTFTISPVDGTLTAVPSNPTTGPNPVGIAVAEAAGHLYAYVIDATADIIYCYTVNPVTGALTFTGFNIATGNGPYGIATDPLGRFAYVTNYTDGSISEYTIDPATGDLIAVGALGGGGHSWFVTIDISGHFLYAAPFCCNEQEVVVYSVNQTTGALTQVSTAGFPGESMGGALYGMWY